MQTTGESGSSRTIDAKLVLIVEDDPDVACSIAMVLEIEGYATAVAHNGWKALEELERRPHTNLILLDMSMPLMDGRAFRAEQEKRAEIASIPVVVVTADGHAESKARSLRANAYLAKPVTMDGLLDVVRRLCQLSS